MTHYSVADAKNSRPRLIDKAVAGEEVVITRHGRPVAELRATTAGAPKSPTAIDEWLIARRDKRTAIDVTSVDLLNEIYETRD